MRLSEETVRFGSLDVSYVQTEIISSVDILRMHRFGICSFYSAILRIQWFVGIISPEVIWL